MKVAIDKNTIGKVKGNYDFIYVFDNEPLDELQKLNMKCMSKDYIESVDINLTDYNIDCLKKANVNDIDWNEIKFKENKIAIIIPNCNYADCLEKCFNSLLNQTYKNFQIIFIDDMSTDNSVEIAQKMLKPPHKVIQLKQKRLNGGARNEAYLHLDDDVDYIWYVDSDDWVKDKNVLETINNKLQSNPDVAFVGMARYKAQQETTIFIPNYKDKYEAIQGWSGSCGKVIKKSLATRQECLYNEGTLKEDRNQHCKICIRMNTFVNIQKPCYVWNQENRKSVTTVRDKVIWGTSTIRHYADTLQLYLSEQGKDPRIDRYLKQRVDQTRQEVMTGGDKQW